MTLSNNMNQEIMSDELLRQAENYLKTDCNASAIKQGMVLESICREYLRCTNEISKVGSAGNEPTLNDMIFYLRKKNIITDSGTSSMCEQIRRNRNEAVHQFRRLNDEAAATLEPLKTFVRKLTDRISILMAPPAKAVSWSYDTIAEQEPSYGTDDRYSQAFARAFIECIRG